MVRPPHIIISCTQEILSLGQELKGQLGALGEIRLWPESKYSLGANALDSLYRMLEWADFALFLIHQPGPLTLKGNLVSVDQLWFEAGFFLGRLGRERLFLLHDHKLQPASWIDPNEMIVATYETGMQDLAQQPSVQAFVRQVHELIRLLGPFQAMDPYVGEALIEDQISYTVKVLNQVGDGEITRQARIRTRFETNEPVVRIKHRMSLDSLTAWDRLGILAWEEQTQEELHVQLSPKPSGTELTYYVYFPDPLEPGEEVIYNIRWHWHAVFGDPHNWFKMIRSANGLTFNLILPTQLPLRTLLARIEVGKLTGTTKKIRFPRSQKHTKGGFTTYTYQLPEAIVDNGPLRVDWWYR